MVELNRMKFGLNLPLWEVTNPSSSVLVPGGTHKASPLWCRLRFIQPWSLLWKQTGLGLPQVESKTSSAELHCRAQKTDSPWAHTKGKTLQRLFNHYNLEFFITGLDLFVVVFILFCFLMCHGRSKRLRVSWGKTLRGTPWLLLCCELQHSTFSLSGFLVNQVSQEVTQNRDSTTPVPLSSLTWVTPACSPRGEIHSKDDVLPEN